MGNAVKTTIQLAKAIQAHGQSITTLSLREPTGAEIIECGMPFDIVSEGKNNRIVINTAALCGYIAALAEIPPSSVKQLSASDFVTCFNVVMGFFGDVKVGT